MAISVERGFKAFDEYILKTGKFVTCRTPHVVRYLADMSNTEEQFKSRLDEYIAEHDKDNNR